jgi:hypothetical protein
MTPTSRSERCVGDPPEHPSKPSACPSCRSENIFPTFDPTVDYFECVRCGNVWELEG